jgi:hypothetical protein
VICSQDVRDRDLPLFIGIGKFLMPVQDILKNNKYSREMRKKFQGPFVESLETQNQTPSESSEISIGDPIWDSIM